MGIFCIMRPGPCFRAMVSLMQHREGIFMTCPFPSASLSLIKGWLR
ncbi:hypothetical protein SXCC_01177 [Gluconacetobacter sp. SXCC-1]|nr:hypothetical protein SXCC_01177 [Gluconacetobacter sp. SXCC-1]